MYIKSFLRQLLSLRGKDLGLLVLRVAAGAMMMTHGLAKIQNFEALSHTFIDPIVLGVKTSLVLIIFAEFFCSLLLVFGFLTRLAAIPLVIGMTVAASAHGFSLDGSELALLYMVIFIMFLLTGAGRYSIDYLMLRRLER